MVARNKQEDYRLNSLCRTGRKLTGESFAPQSFDNHAQSKGAQT